MAGRHGSLPLRRGMMRPQGERGCSVRIGTAQDRSLRKDGCYERMIASRCGTVTRAGVEDRSVRRGTAQDRSVRKDGCASRVDPWQLCCQGRQRNQADERKNTSLTMTMVVVCLMLLFIVVSPVVGQVPTTRLFANPTPLEIDTTIDPTGVVTLEVADGVDIFAFDLFVQYDPALLRVSQVVVGDFLGEGLLCMDQVNDPGLVHYNCTRFGVDFGVSGSGVLLVLTFEALGQGGDTTLALAGSELYFYPDMFPVDLSLEDGAVSVRPYWTYLPLILSASGQGTEALL
jgi:hypothetical protein